MTQLAKTRNSPRLRRAYSMLQADGRPESVADFLHSNKFIVCHQPKVMLWEEMEDEWSNRTREMEERKNVIFYAKRRKGGINKKKWVYCFEIAYTASRTSCDSNF